MIRSLLVPVLALGVITSAAAQEHHHPKRPDPRELHAIQTVRADFRPQPDGSLLVRWLPENRPPSDGIKVVISQDHDQPTYPHDGHLQWIGGVGHDETRIDLRELAHRVDTSRPVFLRLVFVRQGDHEAKRAPHVAVSNPMRIPPEVFAAVHGGHHQGHDPHAKDHGEHGHHDPHAKDGWGHQPQVETWGKQSRRHREERQPIARDHHARKQPPADLWHDQGAHDEAAAKQPVAVEPEVPAAYRGKPEAEALAAEIAELTARKHALERRLAELEAER